MDAGLTQKDLGSYAVTISTPERAIMEVMYSLPREASFEEVALLMEGLTTLRPRMLQVLLEQCRSVKVKRLFMYLAEDCNHAWVQKLDVSKVDFGKGKRMIVKGGRFNSKYNITVPITEHAGSGTGIDRDSTGGARHDQHPLQKRDLQLSARLGHE
jgi:hypothetical protein